MSLDRSLLRAKVITLAGAVLACGNLVYFCLAPERVTIWSVGLDLYFAAMAIYGLILWKRARKKLSEFEEENGRDAGRQNPVS